LRIFSILTDIGEGGPLATQALIYDVYAQVLEQIQSTQTTRASKNLGERVPIPKPAARGEGRDIDTPELRISSARIQTFWPDMSAKEHPGWRARIPAHPNLRM